MTVHDIMDESVNFSFYMVVDFGVVTMTHYVTTQWRGASM